MSVSIAELADASALVGLNRAPGWPDVINARTTKHLTRSARPHT
ncbi:hypothetical protein [Streptomyces sp. NEAU-YJ-81]|nr:hypothetical protein [Streptomyces sp. NEAU-YJ-81]